MHTLLCSCLYRHLGYERVYLPLGKVADTPFHIQGDDILLKGCPQLAQYYQCRCIVRTLYFYYVVNDMVR